MNPASIRSHDTRRFPAAWNFSTGWVLGWTSILSAAAADPATVATVRPSRGEIVRYVALPGSLRPNQQVTLQARVAGFIKSIAVDRGDRVKAGQSLAEIEVPELLAERAKHIAEAKVAEIENRRLEAVREKAPDLVTPQTRDAATGRWEIARAQLEMAETLLRYATVTAPFAGVVTARFVDPGAFVPAGSGGSSSSLLTLADTSVLRAQVQVPEAEAILVQVGQPVRISVEGLAGQIFTTTVSRHSDSLEDATRALWVEADLPNTQGRLRPGMYATIRIGVEKHPAALLVPAEALMVERNATFVFLVEGNRSKKTPVKIGFQDGPNAEILSGITDGAAIISPGKSAPPDGTAVRLKESP